ncbi:MAG: hypothetical protein ABEK50_08880 [bacterium]
MTVLTRRTLFICLLLAWIVSPLRDVHACSVCFTEGSPLARYAYYGTTAGLILLPGGLVTGFVLWIRSVERNQSSNDGRPGK